MPTKKNSKKSPKKKIKKLSTARKSTKKSVTKTVKKSSPRKKLANKRVNPVKRKPKVAAKGKKLFKFSAEPDFSIHKLTKPEKNPIIQPNGKNDWEAWQTFNPGAILLGDKVHFIYRAIGQDGVSRFGYAASSDGLTIDERLDDPVYEHKTGGGVGFNIHSYFSGGSFAGAEDPRIACVGDEERLYVTYTACDDGIRMALTSISVSDFLNKRWRWKSPVLISKPNEVGKNWVVFPEKIGGKYAILHSTSPEMLVSYFDSLERFDGLVFIDNYYRSELKKDCWDGGIRGVGPTPLKTEYGWLVFYHTMSAGGFGKYQVGAMLLDLRDPAKILVRSSGPVIDPDSDYENNGFKPGVVYATGAVIKDGKIFVYYGGADSYVCVAYGNFEEFLGLLLRESQPKLSKRAIKRK